MALLVYSLKIAFGSFHTFSFVGMHLQEYGDCLQAPVILTKWLVKKQKTTPYSALEKLLFYLIFILIPAYPIYWLLSNKILLLAFLVAAGMWYLGQFLYFCKKCRLSDCPFNRVSLAHKQTRP